LKPRAESYSPFGASDHLLSAHGVRDALLSLGARTDRQVVILGGSHSAFSAAWALTDLLPPGMFSAGSIRLLYRNRMRVFYRSAEEALADGYSDFTASGGRSDHLRTRVPASYGPGFRRARAACAVDGRSRATFGRQQLPCSSSRRPIIAQSVKLSEPPAFKVRRSGFNVRRRSQDIGNIIQTIF
jgi:hypothetical protein